MQVHPSQLDAKGELALLTHYHSELMAAARTGVEYPFDAFVRHYELAVLDYVRFMAGWGFWGNARWAQQRARAVLRERHGELAGLAA